VHAAEQGLPPSPGVKLFSPEMNWQPTITATITVVAANHRLMLIGLPPSERAVNADPTRADDRLHPRVERASGDVPTG
jgi:hypothetical protein